jgi:quercetin dioxygenase-like cupin family protein
MQAHDGPHKPGITDKMVLSQPIAELDGNHLKATVEDVTFAPGQGVTPHQHGCPVIAYVVKGSIRSQIAGQELKTYKAGEAFYEDANTEHVVTTNASKTQPAEFVAFFLCDHDVPLTTRGKGDK